MFENWKQVKKKKPVLICWEEQMRMNEIRIAEEKKISYASKKKSELTKRSINSFYNSNDHVVAGGMSLRKVKYRRYRQDKVYLKDFEIIQPIGKGGFSTIYLVKLKKTGKFMVMKVMRKRVKSEFFRVKTASLIRSERDAYVALNQLIDSPWIVPLWYCFQDQMFVFFVMEFCPGNDLSRFISTDACGELSEDEFAFYFAQMLAGLEVIHGAGIVHGDIKPENILLDDKGFLKYTDLGLCKVSDRKVKNGTLLDYYENVVKETGIGSLKYMAPELLKGEERSESSDIWSLGCVLYEMLLNKPLFYSPRLEDRQSEEVAKARIRNNIMNYEEFLKGGNIFPVKEFSWVDLIKLMVSDKKTRDRIKIEDLKNHVFFKENEIDYENIRNIEPPVPLVLKGDADTSRFPNPADIEDILRRHVSEISFVKNRNTFNKNVYSQDDTDLFFSSISYYLADDEDMEEKKEEKD